MKKTLLITFLLVSLAGLLKADSWTLQSGSYPLNFARYGAMGFSIGTNEYIGCGCTTFPNFSYQKDFWKFDSLSSTWTQKADFPDHRFRGTGFAINNYGYFCSGDSGAVLYNDLWKYDTTANAWIYIDTIPGVKRMFMVSFVINGKAYVGSGMNLLGNTLNDFYEFNPAGSGSWTAKTPMPHHRYSAAAFAIGSFGYVGMGDSSYTPPHRPWHDFWKFDPSGSGTWTQIANYPGSGRTKAFAFSIGNRGFVGGGCDSLWNPFFNDFWSYNPATDQWVQKASYGFKITEPVSFNIHSKGYAGTGLKDSSTLTSQFWIYTPDTVTNVGIDEINISISNLNTYPNPSNGAIRVDYTSKESSSLLINVVSITGEIIYSETRKQIPGNNNFNLDLSGNSAGIYFVELISGNDKIVKRIILE